MAIPPSPLMVAALAAPDAGQESRTAPPSKASLNGHSHPSSSSSSSSSSSPDYRLVFTLQGHKRSISSLCFSPDGNYLVSSGSDRVLKIWSLQTGALCRTLSGHELGISQACWSPDGRYIASASDDRTVRIWESSTGAEVRRFTGHTSYVFCVAYSPTSNLVVSGSFDETVRLWDVRQGTCHRTIAAHSEAVTGVDFNRDGTMIISCSYDGLIRLWDSATGQCHKTLLHSDNAPVSSVRFTPSGAQMLASSLDSTIRLWDIANGRVLKSFTGHGNTKFAAVATLGAPRWIGGREVEGLRERLRELEGRLALQAQGEGRDDEADVEDNKKLDELRKDLGRKEEMLARGIPEMVLVSGSEDHKIYVWDLQTKKVLRTLVGHRDAVLGVTAHPTQPIIASASLDHDPSIKIWIEAAHLEALERQGGGGGGGLAGLARG